MAKRAGPFRGLAERDELDRPEEAGGERGPHGGVEGLVVDVDEVDLMEGFPIHLAAVEVGDAVGGEVGDFDFEDVLAFV